MIRKMLTFLLLLFSLVFTEEFVIVRQETLFTVDNAENALSIAATMDSILDEGELDTLNIFVDKTDSGWCIGYDTTFLLCYPLELGDSAEILAHNSCEKLVRFISNPPKTPPISFKGLLKFLLAMLAPIVFVLLILLINKFIRKIIKYLIYQEGKLIKGVRFGKFTLLPAREELLLVINILRWGRIIIFIFLFYIMLLYIFHLYPATQAMTDSAIEYSFKVLRNIGIFVLEVIGFAVGAFFLYVIARIILKIIDVVFRHYEQAPESLSIPFDALVPLRDLVKLLVALVFVLGFIAIIPGPGATIALVGLFIVLGILGFSFIPLLRHYVTGYAILFKGLIAVNDRIVYKDRWWIVETVSPLILGLVSLDDKDRAFVPFEDFISKGFIAESRKNEEIEEVEEEKTGNDGDSENQLNIN